MLFALLAIVAYFGALLWVMPSLANLENQSACRQPNTKAVFGLGMVAVFFHLLAVSNALFLADGQNFTLTNVGALISLLMSAVATLALPKWRTVWFPLIIVYAFGICSLAVASFVTGSFIKHLQQSAGLLFHLAIALFSYALFVLALLYAIQLNWLDRKLKSKKMYLNAVLPPLMTVERHFFTLTLVAQGLLTLTLITGMIYLHNFFAPEQVHKAIFSFGAWLIYSIQLLGQWKLHWRGKRVLIYSISGIMLLTFGYFGSRLV